MDVQDAALVVAAQTALGWVWQLTMRAPKSIPAWAGYAGLGVASLVLFWFANREATSLLQSDWRIFILQVVSFFQAARGMASVSKDAKVAPATDSK